MCIRDRPPSPPPSPPPNQASPFSFPPASGRKLMAFGVCASAAPTPPPPTPPLNDTDSGDGNIVKRARKWLGVSPSIAGSVALGLVVLLAICVLFARSQCSARYRDSDHDGVEPSMSHNRMLDVENVPRRRLRRRTHSSLQSPASEVSSSDDDMPRPEPSYNALRVDSNRRRKTYATVNNVLTSTSLFLEGRAKEAHNGGRYRP